ncbi:hypothetical protein [Amycolatopsis lexingtonensis]|uniref:hypothetical protein n=1 Tax=Amycolatopsis lexingtonensis TaxID=218822 RepID=UPI003F6E633C
MGATRLWLGEHRRRTPLSDNGIKIMLRRRGRAAGAQKELGRDLHAHLGRQSQSHHFLKAGGSEGGLILQPHFVISGVSSLVVGLLGSVLMSSAPV